MDYINPPAALDSAIIIKRVWPAFSGKCAAVAREQPKTAELERRVVGSI
jgi:hypothetical protein